MKILALFSILFVLTGVSISEIQAQNPSGGRVTQTAQLATLSREAKQLRIQNYQKALALARLHKWTLVQVLPDGTYVSLQGVTENNQPIYYSTDSNTRAAATTRTNQLWTGGTLGLNLRGNTPVVSGKMGVWDGGRVYELHRELLGRVTQRDNSSTTSNHATHVAGTMIASGVNPLVRGMAYEYQNLQAFDYNDDESEMAANAANLLISNHSYGTVSGWYNDGSGWTWFGDTRMSETEDYKFGFYSTDTQKWDNICFNAPYYLPVKSAGNNRAYNGPSVGQSFLRRTASGSTEFVSSRPAEMSSNDGYDIISTYGTAKNILTVGAVYAIPDGYSSPADVLLSNFSSWGPTDDGRIKPDLVANGVDLLSSWSTSSNAYSTISGTSMATPNVSGSLLLLQEYYYQKNNVFMRSATLKGLAIHTTDEAGPTAGPDYRFGWGLLNTEKAARVIKNSGNTHQIIEQNLAENETFTLNLIASGQESLIATLCWTDPAATPRSLIPANLNNRTPLLINDLDIRVISSDSIYMPWTLNPNLPANAAVTADNIRDNVEQICIANTIPGKTYTIRISYKGVLQNKTQAYSLIISGIGGKEYCTSQPQSEANGFITSVTFGSIQSTSIVGACATYTDFTRLSATVTSGQTLPLTVSVGSCGTPVSQIVKVYIDWNNDGDFDDVHEGVATSGLLTGTASFQIPVTIPSGISGGTAVRMRLVSVETSTAADIKPCGSYGKGETEDYTLYFASPVTDVGISSIVSDEQQSFCLNSPPSVVVKVKNYATKKTKGISVTVSIAFRNSTLASVNKVITTDILPQSEATLTFANLFVPAVSGQYTITASTSLLGDQDAGNNIRVIARTLQVVEPPMASATVCAGVNRLFARSLPGTVYWYDSQSGGKVIATGHSPVFKGTFSGSSVYVGLNDFSGSLGAVSKTVFGGGTYGNAFASLPVLEASVPLVLEKARLYIGSAGKITFTLQNEVGMVVSSTSLDVTPTRNTSVPAMLNGQYVDDPNDMGRVYDLNLLIPQAGTYRLSVSCENGATLFRSHTNVSGYPFEIANVIRLNGVLTATSMIQTEYDYLYDIKVKAFGCPSPRIQVPVQIIDSPAPTATISGSATICEGSATPVSIALTGTPPWTMTYIFNNEPVIVRDITTSPYVIQASQPGTYTIYALSDSKSCPVSDIQGSATISFYPTPTAFMQTEGYTLTANAGLGYRWFLNGTPLDTASQRTLVAYRRGRYSVEVTSQDGCKARSEEVIMTDANTEDLLTGGWLAVFPNPTTDKLQVYLGQAHQVTKVYVLNTLGKSVFQHSVVSREESVVIEMTSLAAGTYVVVIEGASQQKRYKIIKL